MKPLDIIRNGIATENPTFVLLLGMCPTLATTTSALNGLAMGLATMFVLICSNTAISLIKHLVPDAVRIPSFIVVIAGFVTIVQMLMQAFVPSLYASLGLFLLAYYKHIRKSCKSCISYLKSYLLRSCIDSSVYAVFLKFF